MSKLVDAVIAEIDEFLERNEMAPTDLGKRALNDGHFVFDLKRTHNSTLARIERVREFMCEFERLKRGRSRIKVRRQEAAA